jgi:parvulin-like peptidyl-prolyl isomerase
MKNRMHGSVLTLRVTSGATSGVKLRFTLGFSLRLNSIFVLVVAALLAAFTPNMRAQSKPAADADIVARVNNDVITLSDYQKAEQQLRDEVTRDCQGCPQGQIDAQFKEQQKDLLRGMIDQSLMVQRARDMGISVEADLTKRLDEVRKQNGLATLDDLQKGVEASGFSWEGYKTTIRDGLLQKEVVQREVGAHVDISNDEVKQYYDAHQQEFTLPERVMLSEISLSTEGKSPEEFAGVRAKVEGLRTSVLNGDDFNRVAQLYSQGSRDRGGQFGYLQKGRALAADRGNRFRNEQRPDHRRDPDSHRIRIHESRRALPVGIATHGQSGTRYPQHHPRAESAATPARLSRRTPRTKQHHGEARLQR